MLIQTALIAALLVGPAHAEAPAETPPAAGNAARYQVGAGDVLHVEVYGEPKLTGAFPVNDGGELDFPLLGPVRVEGSTAAQVAATLRSRLSEGYLVEPNVTAWLQGYNSQPVQVLGAVGKPGLYHLKGETTVLELLTEAGGVAGAGVDEIRITHGDEGDQVTMVPYEALLERGEGNVTLSGGDIVFVPELRVSVMGAVKSPGDVAFRDDLTITTCLSGAGGALPVANLGRVFILRDGKRIRVNMRKVLSGKAEDMPMIAGDRVFVRESAF
jgi:polysaccharide biosynthesis/export protein